MKTLSLLLAGATLYGGFQIYNDGSNEDRPAVQAASGEVFRLVANGDEAACSVRRGDRIADGLSALTLAPDCGRVLPGIERARFWWERDDGTIAFSADGIDPIVTFAIADGDGYDSYAPAAPLLSLAAVEN
ncbi:MAG: hypothetical protein QM762_06955 [Chryseolinea sp.]